MNWDYDDWLLEQQEQDMKTASWRTTVTGILAILAAVATVLKAELDGDAATVPDWGAAVAAALAGIGLIAARDNSVTSEQAGAVPPAQP